ncbi:Metallo-beta-lactamase family protein, RNA-specific [Methylophaga frappieri]|uniref:Metallo-beta-lactamase family protein, RNA-specific n=1 Tax=Methylophaga frappieri (strain ATCC BAA-2434 / DSM 25690 / JAM7) TaxID=754477 RepID=I1YER6_METFJ|nr:ribonuclease J [Methylophaga frappieri]AFJ01409.1 Metallo-beta-lactamase family protein, RNA-specific [Methylophaga frappieri]
MNLNLYGHNGRWLMVDCGVTFENPENDAHVASHAEIQMADPQFIADRYQQLDGLVITHAHEDHIGAVAYLWPRLKCPVYTTAFTAEILRRKLSEAGLAEVVPVIVVDPSESQQIGVFNVSWLRLTHSIPEPFALLISTSVGKVFHTADWKLDKSPVVGAAFDAADFKALAAAQINAMVCDSTNANMPGWSISESALYEGLLKHVQHATGRVIVTCFGSNIARLKTLARIADETGRHLGLMGRSLRNNYSAAKVSGFWENAGSLVDSSHLGFLPRQTVMLIATGSQGEPRTALNRLSHHSFRDMQLEAGDTVIFSSKVIPGNEQAIAELIERLKAMQVDVIDEHNSALPIHASGHPATEELKMMYQWVQPDCAIPVHGEMHHLRANAGIAKSVGIRQQLVGQNGDIFYISPAIGIRRHAVPVGRLGMQRNGKLKKLY